MAGTLCALPVRVVPRYLSSRQYGAGCFCGGFHGGDSRDPRSLSFRGFLAHGVCASHDRAEGRGRGIAETGGFCAALLVGTRGTGLRDGDRGYAGPGGFSAAGTRVLIAAGTGSFRAGDGGLLRCGDSRDRAKGRGRWWGRGVAGTGVAPGTGAFCSGQHKSHAHAARLSGRPIRTAAILY